MINPLHDLTGQKFGRLKVIRRSANDKWGNTMWECECDCGNIKNIHAHDLIKGSSKSCGCLKNELSRKRLTTHGLSSTRLYEIHRDMKRRCYSPSSSEYKNYGLRGIKVCDEWMHFENFANWALKNGYSENLTIDRIDVNGNYEPNNCRWATIEIQNNNKRNTIYLTLEGETKPMHYWCKQYGVNENTIYQRIIIRKWSALKALSTPTTQKE